MISEWLFNHYKKKFDPDSSKGFTVLQHETGSTWNDGGAWNNTIVMCGTEVFRIYMPSDYCCDKLEITKMKKVIKEVYEVDG